MVMSLLSWLVLLTFYMLYILLGGCMFNHIEDQKDLRDREELEWSRNIKGPCTYVCIEGCGEGLVKFGQQ